jgi:hypothetical protein
MEEFNLERALSGEPVGLTNHYKFLKHIHLKKRGI